MFDGIKEMLPLELTRTFRNVKVLLCYEPIARKLGNRPLRPGGEIRIWRRIPAHERHSLLSFFVAEYRLDVSRTVENSHHIDFSACCLIKDQMLLKRTGDGKPS